MSLENLGRIDELIETCRSAVESADALLRERPTDRECIWLAARSSNNLAISLAKKATDMAEIRTLRQRVLDLSRDVPLDGSSFSEELYYVRTCCPNSMTIEQFNRGDFSNIQSNSDSIVDAFRRLNQQSPKEYRSDLAQCLLLQARVAGKLKSEAAALPIYRQALELLNALNEEFPGKVKIRDQLVACKSQMGLTYARLRQRELSLQMYDEALKMQLQLINEFPSIPNAAAQNLSHWKQDPELELLRNSDVLSKLPAEERTKIESFWRELDSLVETVTHKKDSK